MFLHEAVEFSARRHPDATALIFGDHAWTFRELDERIGRISTGLMALCEPGERIAILAENRPEFVELYYAAPRAGVILTFLNYRLHPSEWAATIEASGASVVVAERALLDRLSDVLDKSARTVVALEGAQSDEVAYESLLAATTAPPRSTSETDVGWLLYTSGTTGRPKGAMLTHRSILAAVNALSIARPVLADDIYLFVFPLCHVAGYNVVAFHLHGRPVVLLRRFDPLATIDAINRHAATQLSLAPTMIDMLLDVPGIDAEAVPSLRGIGYGASPIPSEVLRRGLDLFGCDFSQGYGMTELSGNAVFLDAADHRRAVSGDDALLTVAGRPSPLVSVAVVDDLGDPVGVGEVGEIVVSGDQLLTGYWNDDAATAEALVDGWFRTGDLGRFDERGYLSVIDRRKDVIVSGGENIASREVEDVIQRLAGVKEVAVVGVPDVTWGEDVCAVVVADADVGAEAIVRGVQASLASYKKPKHVVFVDALPRNHAGKVLKRQLRVEMADRLE